MFYVYILRSTDNQLYIGQTQNIDDRLKDHINKSKDSAKYIKDGKDFYLVYLEVLDSRLNAMRRELQLKRWTRAKKEALIANNIEELKKLSKSKFSKK